MNSKNKNKFVAELTEIIQQNDVQRLKHLLKTRPISPDNLARAQVVAFNAMSWGCFRALICHPKADVDRPLLRKDKGTLLHLAAYNGNPRTVKLLLDKKARTNVVNVYGETPYRSAKAGLREMPHRRLDYEKVLSILDFAGGADGRNPVRKNHCQPTSVPQKPGNKKHHQPYQNNSGHGSSRASVPIKMQTKHCQRSAGNSHRDTHHFRHPCAKMRQDHHSDGAGESEVEFENFCRSSFFDQDHFGSEFPTMPSMENFFSEPFASSGPGNSVDWFQQRTKPESSSLFDSAQLPCTHYSNHSHCGPHQSKQQHQPLHQQRKQAQYQPQHRPPRKQSHPRQDQEAKQTSTITFHKGERVLYIKRSPACVSVVTNVDTAGDVDLKTYGIRVENDSTGTVLDVLASSLRKLS